MRFAKVDTTTGTIELITGNDTVVIDDIEYVVGRIAEAVRLDNDIWPVVAEGEQPSYHVPNGDSVSLDADAKTVKITRLFTPMPLADAVTALCATVDDMKDRIQGSGFLFSHDGVDYRVASDLQSRQNILLAYSAGLDGVWSTTFTVRDSATGEKVQLALDNAGAITLGRAWIDHHNASHQAAQVHKAAIETLPSIEDVAAYETDTLPTGWPENPAVAGMDQ